MVPEDRPRVVVKGQSGLVMGRLPTSFPAAEAGWLKSNVSPTDSDKPIAKGKYGIESLKFSTQLSTSWL